VPGQVKQRIGGESGRQISMNRKEMKLSVGPMDPSNFGDEKE
jgi:hypothetical protein